MDFIKTKFYASMDNDQNLTRPELGLFKLLCGFWVANGAKHLEELRYPEVFEARRLKIIVMASHAVLIKKLKYKDDSSPKRIIKSLVAKGYLKYRPGTGREGQLSRFSTFTLLIPTDYDLPTRKIIPQDVRDKMLESQLVSKGMPKKEVTSLLFDLDMQKNLGVSKTRWELGDYIKNHEIKERRRGA